MSHVPRRPLFWPAIIETLRSIMPGGQEVYLVGGAVRDAYLQRPLHDIDLATPNDGRPLARHIANALGGAYYSLDANRGVGRAIVPQEDGKLTVDAAQFRGPDLYTDLQKRDFTLNAMAVQLAGNLQTVIDPLGGLDDLDSKRLRQCTPQSISDDPVRALRAVRASVIFKLHIEPDTRQSLVTHAPQLKQVSCERVRDEFFQILNSPRPAAALAVLYHLELLEQIIPEVRPLPDVEQGPPHQFNVWKHTLATIKHLDTILSIIASRRSDNLTANLQAGMIAFALDPLRLQLQVHLSFEWPNERTHRALLLLAALLHDSGKHATRSTDSDGRIRFLGHEQVGEHITANCAASLRLSKDELTRLATIVRHHMRPHWLNTAPSLTSRAIYRFWRDTGVAGIDICLLAIADYLGTYGTALDSQAWLKYLETIQALLNQYFLHHNTTISPPPLITGQHLLDHFQLEPGPQIGALLEQVREAQVEGSISTREEALNWVQRLLDNPS